MNKDVKTAHGLLSSMVLLCFSRATYADVVQEEELKKEAEHVEEQKQQLNELPPKEAKKKRDSTTVSLGEKICFLGVYTRDHGNIRGTVSQSW